MKDSMKIEDDLKIAALGGHLDAQEAWFKDEIREFQELQDPFMRGMEALDIVGCLVKFPYLIDHLSYKGRDQFWVMRYFTFLDIQHLHCFIAGPFSSHIYDMWAEKQLERKRIPICYNELRHVLDTVFPAVL